MLKKRLGDAQINSDYEAGFNLNSRGFIFYKYFLYL
jgi:hypothetical protein